MDEKQREKKAEREAFWAEYKRRLALKDERKREMEVLMGFHSSVLAGSSVVNDYLPAPHYSAAIAVTGNRPQMRRTAPKRTTRRQTPQ